MIPQFIMAHKEMNGFNPRSTRPFSSFNFKSGKPEIELYEIVAFLTELGKSRAIGKSLVYINLCMYGKWYVGITTLHNNTIEEQALYRLERHRDNGAETNWTWAYPVISTMIFIPGDLTDEDLITRLIAKCVGAENVRGGIWASPHATIPMDMSVNDIKTQLTGR